MVHFRLNQVYKFTVADCGRNQPEIYKPIAAVFAPRRTLLSGRWIRLLGVNLLLRYGMSNFAARRSKADDGRPFSRC